MKFEIDEVDIRHFKLIDGNEVIGYIRGMEDHGYIVESPLLMNIYNEERMQRIFMTPWFTVQPDSLTVFINADTVIATCKASENTKEKYIATALRLREVYPDDDLASPEINDEGHDDDDWEEGVDPLDNIDPKTTVH